MICLRTIIIFTMLVCIFFFHSVKGEASDNGKDHPPLYFSLVPKKNVDQQISELTPLLKLLEKKMDRQVVTIYPHSYQSVIEGLLSQTIDFAILGPAAYAKARNRDGQIEAFAAFARKKGYVTPRGSFYHSVLFTCKEHGVDAISALQGRRVALTDPASTSGSVIPHVAFSGHIQDSLSSFFGTLIYTGSHDRSIRSVVNKDVDAAFVSSARIDEAIEKKILSPDQVVILWRSDPIHSDPFVFSSGVDRAVKDQIRQIILSAASQLSDMLNKMQMVDIVPVGDADYRAVHEIVNRQDGKK